MSNRKERMKKISLLVAHDHSDELGDFSDLDETNITKDEAFSAGCSVCGEEGGSCGHPEDTDGSIYIEELINLANHLESSGLHKDANVVDVIIRKHSS